MSDIDLIGQTSKYPAEYPCHERAKNAWSEVGSVGVKRRIRGGSGLASALTSASQRRSRRGMRSCYTGGGLGACRRGIGRHRTRNISIADMQQIHRHACTRASGKSSGEAGERPKQASRRSAMRPFSKQAARRQAGPGLRGLAKFQITALVSPSRCGEGRTITKTVFHGVVSKKHFCHL